MSSETSGACARPGARAPPRLESNKEEKTQGDFRAMVELCRWHDTKFHPQDNAKRHSIESVAASDLDRQRARPPPPCLCSDSIDFPFSFFGAGFVLCYSYGEANTAYRTLNIPRKLLKLDALFTFSFSSLLLSLLELSDTQVHAP